MTAPEKKSVGKNFERWTLHRDPYGVMVVCYSSERGQTLWCDKNGYSNHVEVIPVEALAAERRAAEEALDDLREANSANEMQAKALAAAEKKIGELERDIRISFDHKTLLEQAEARERKMREVVEAAKEYVAWLGPKKRDALVAALNALDQPATTEEK